MFRWLGAVLLAAFITFASTPSNGQPIIGQNFTGSTTALLNPPPDTMGAVGDDHFVELNNHFFRVYNKSDGSLVQTIGDTQFWTNSGASVVGASFDPRIVYDNYAKRWYAVAVDNGKNPNNFLFAVSSSADPTQPWSGFSIDSDTFDTHWADFPMLGYTAEGIYITANMATLTAPVPDTTILVLPKIDLLQPAPSIANRTLIEHVPFSTTGFSPQVAIDDSNQYGFPIQLLSMDDVVAGDLIMSEVTTPGAPAIGSVTTFTIGGLGNPPDVDQPGPAQDIEANDARFSGNTVLRNGELYAVHAIDNAGTAAIRFLRIDVANGALLEERVINNPGSLAMTFPSIAINETGDVVIGYTGTSTTEFASSYVSVGKRLGAVTLFDPPTLLKAGVAEYVRLDSIGRNRWGDYSATTIDPADPNIFWTVQEFASSTNNWSTQVSEVIVPLSNEARWANSVTSAQFDDPTQWNTFHGALPLPNERLVFSRPTDPGGVPMTITFPPQPAGTYVYDGLSVRQGDIIFDLNGNHLDLPLDLEVGPFAGSPDVTIANGVVQSSAGFIAPRPNAEGHLTLDNTHWIVDFVDIGSDASPGTAGIPILPGSGGGVGSLTIDNASLVEVNGPIKLWQSAEVNLLDGTLIVQTIDNNSIGDFNFLGGTLHVEFFEGELTNTGGVLAPGSPTGDTTVLLNYTQLAGGTLAIDISSALLGQFDRLVTFGTADLDGVLDVNLLGYSAALGDTFEIVSAGFVPVTSALNLLANSTLPSLGQLLDFHLFHNANALTLAVVPSLTGDFNADGIVNAADYTVWRDTTGQMGIGLAADANFDGTVDQVDYLLWVTNYGAIAPAITIPEPATGLLTIISVAFIAGPRFRRRSHCW